MGDFEQLLELLKIKLEKANIEEYTKHEKDKVVSFCYDNELVKLLINQYDGIKLIHRKFYDLDKNWYKSEENIITEYVNCKTYINLFIK